MTTFLICAHTAVLSLYAVADVGDNIIQTADGFDYPVGNDPQSPATSTYVDANGKTHKGWGYGGTLGRDYLAAGDKSVTLHPGQDWNGKGGGETDFRQPVYAAAPGTVVFAADGGCGWGNIVLIEHTAPLGAQFTLPTGLVARKVWSQYAHLDEIDSKVIVGSSVSRRQIVGLIGHGYDCERDDDNKLIIPLQKYDAYSAHLHFEIRTPAIDGDPATWPLSASFWPSSAKPKKDETWVRSHYVDPSQYIELNTQVKPASASDAPIAGFTMHASSIERMEGETLTTPVSSAGLAPIHLRAACLVSPLGCGSIREWRWKVSGLTQNPASSPSVQISLPQGRSTISLVVIDDDGRQSPEAAGTAVITARNVSPHPELSVTDELTLSLFNIDDSMRVTLNNQLCIETGFGTDTVIDLHRRANNQPCMLRSGTNTLNLELTNGSQGGWSYGFQLKAGSNLLRKSECGQIGVSGRGCGDDDQSRGIVFTDTYRIVKGGIVSGVSTPVPRFAMSGVDGTDATDTEQLVTTGDSFGGATITFVDTSDPGTANDIVRSWTISGRSEQYHDSPLSIRIPIGPPITVTLTLMAQGTAFSTSGEVLVVPPVVPNRSPSGSIDGVNSLNQVFGWATDPDDVSVPITVHLYIDKNAGTPGAVAVPVTADEFRSDVGNHAFNWNVPESLRDGQTHTVWAWGIDLTDPEHNNVVLPGSPKTFSISSAPPCAALPAGLLSWWSGDNNAADILRRNNGTLFGSAGFDVGKVASAFKFDGGSGYVRIPDAPSLDFTNAMTVDAWIFPTTFPGSRRTIVAKWDAVEVHQRSYTLNLEPSGRVLFRVSSNGDEPGYPTNPLGALLSSGAVSLNQWSHLAATYDGQFLRLYVNGALDSQVAYDRGVFAGTDALGIGATVGGLSPGQLVGTSFVGSIDEVDVFSRALSDNEIRALFEAGGDGKCHPVAMPDETPTPFYEDGQTNSAFGQLTVDSQGRLRAIRNVFGFACGFGYCGMRLASISPSGSVNWETEFLPTDNFGARGLAVGPSGRAYVLGRNTAYAIESDGSSASGWPVSVAGDGRFLLSGFGLDPSSGNVYAGSRVTQSFTGFPALLFGLRSDGAATWTTGYANGNGVVALADSARLFSIVDNATNPVIANVVGIDTATGVEVCRTAAPTPGTLIAGDHKAFASLGDQVFAYSSSCQATMIFQAAVGTVQLQRYVAGTVVGVNSIAANQSRLLGIRANGSSSWTSPDVAVLDVSAIRASDERSIYVIGQDLTDGGQQKLFVLDALTGETRRRVATQEICASCGVAVASDGTIYINDLNSTKIFKVKQQ